MHSTVDQAGGCHIPAAVEEAAAQGKTVLPGSDPSGTLAPGQVRWLLVGRGMLPMGYASLCAAAHLAG